MMDNPAIEANDYIPSQITYGNEARAVSGECRCDSAGDAGIMKRCQYLLFFVLFFIIMQIGTAANAESMKTYNCPGPNAPHEDRATHVDLLRYASLAKFAYKELGTATLNLFAICPLGIRVQAQQVYEVDIRLVPGNIVTAAINRIRESHPHWKIDPYFDKAGEKFHTCTNGQTATERLAVAFRYAFNNEGPSLFFRIAIIGVSGLTGKQKIGIVELKNAHGEKIIGFQGTNLSDIDLWNTSIQNLMEDESKGVSCAFPLAVAISSEYFGDAYAGERCRGMSRYSIVGHSLGGAVVQHVTLNADLKKIIEKYHNTAKFAAYSFSSIGVISQGENVTKRPTANSVRVAGEILEKLQGTVNRGQIGHVFRYGLPSKQPSMLERMQRHGIKWMMVEICDCLADHHRTYEYGYR